jgi:thiaminase (transcriptional activator TenA)
MTSDRAMTAAALWDANAEIARACLRHPFVQGIATGALSRASFQVYVAQDAFFLEAFARAYALALAKSPDRDGLDAFKELLGGVFDELGLHAGYAARWGIDLTPEPLPATQAYTSFLLSTAALEPVGHAVAAMTPCMRLYAWLGTSLAAAGVSSGSPYREWVATYADEGFGRLVDTLEGLLERYRGEPARIASHYRTAMALELGFFEAAWQAGTPGG